jgi:hypothetical protein
MVGRKTSGRLSVSAALSYLSYFSGKYKVGRIKEILDSRNVDFLAGESSDERQLINTGIIALAEVIERSGIDAKALAESTYKMVIKSDGTLITDSGKRTEVYGLLHSPGIEKKLALYGDPAAVERQREALGKVLLNHVFVAGSKFKFSDFDEILRDHHLPISAMIQIFKSEDPETTEREVKKRLAYQTTKSAYLIARGGGIEDKIPLNEWETQMINKLSNISHYRLRPEDLNLDPLVAAIALRNEAITLLNTARAQFPYLEGTQPFTHLPIRNALNELQYNTDYYNEIREISEVAKANRKISDSIRVAVKEIVNEEHRVLLTPLFEQAVAHVGNVNSNEMGKGMMIDRLTDLRINTLEQIISVLRLPSNLQELVLSRKLQLSEAIHLSQLPPAPEPVPSQPTGSRQVSVSPTPQPTSTSEPRNEAVRNQPAESKVKLSPEVVTALQQIIVGTLQLPAERLPLEGALRQTIIQTINALGLVLTGRRDIMDIVTTEIEKEHAKREDDIRQNELRSAPPRK